MTASYLGQHRSRRDEQRPHDERAERHAQDRRQAGHVEPDAAVPHDQDGQAVPSAIPANRTARAMPTAGDSAVPCLYRWSWLNATRGARTGP